MRLRSAQQASQTNKLAAAAEKFLRSERLTTAKYFGKKRGQWREIIIGLTANK